MEAISRKLAVLGAVLVLPACSKGDLHGGATMTFGSGAPGSGVAEDSGDSEGSTSGDEGETEEPPEGSSANTTEPPIDCNDGDSQQCYSGAAGSEGVGACRAGQQTCTAGVWGPCEGEVTPGIEICNSADDDCDGEVDGAAVDGASCTTDLPGVCADGATTCSDGVETCEPTIQPGATEVCDNGDDDNCDGEVDEGCSAGVCDPMSPTIECGANNHCIPQPDGTPLCVTPTGPGTQYDICTANDECAPEYECIVTPFDTLYCMEWCESDLDCGIFDFCTQLDPSVFVGATEYGVCWDGFA